MFISVLDIFKVGIGPSSSHTMGPMIAAHAFRERVLTAFDPHTVKNARLRCVLYGSLAHTGRGHSTDTAVLLGLHGYLPGHFTTRSVTQARDALHRERYIGNTNRRVFFQPEKDLLFDFEKTFAEHPNTLSFELWAENGRMICQEAYFSIGGGFVLTAEKFRQQTRQGQTCGDMTTRFPFPFASAEEMLALSARHRMSISQMKKANELILRSESTLNRELDAIVDAMRACVENGLRSEGFLPGALRVARRAKKIFEKITASPGHNTVNEYLCAYAMAVNEENAVGHMVVTAPTNGAAGVLPAVLYYLIMHHEMNRAASRSFLLTAAAICGLIKHSASISGAEVGCQGEVGSAAAIAAAGACEFFGGTAIQIENAAEIALEHHLGMTCDPVLGLVQIPCIERNGFGAIKAMTASSLALRESGSLKITLDSCIETMRQTGLDMHTKYKETSLGGLAANYKNTATKKVSINHVAC